MIRVAPRKTRSLALSILAILSGIGSALSILSGALLFVSGALFATSSEILKQQPKAVQRELQTMQGGAELPGGMTIFQFMDLLGNILYGLAVAFLVGGVFYIFVTRALWRRQRWAYITALVFSALGGLWCGFSLLAAVYGRVVSLSLVFEIGLQALMIALTAISYRDFFGPKVRFAPAVEWADDVEHYNNGIAYKKRGMWYMVVKEWEAAVGRAPKELRYLHGLGLAYAQLKHFEQARAMLDRALLLAPDDTQVRDSRAFVERLASSRSG
jgi:tetratricopeptide (TPR) repeat protein